MFCTFCRYTCSPLNQETHFPIFVLLLTYFYRNLASFYASCQLQFHVHFGLSSICLYYSFIRVLCNVTYFHALHTFFFLHPKSVKAYNLVSLLSLILKSLPILLFCLLPFIRIMSSDFIAIAIHHLSF